MKSFKIGDREWSVIINTNTVKRVREMTKFDLLKVVEDRDALQSLNDPILFVDVLFAVCKPQADAASITDVAFGESIADGDILESAQAALLESLADFFPRHRREPLKKAVAKLKQIQDRVAAMQTERIESPELEKQILDSVRTAINSPLPELGKASGNSPA